MRILYLTQILSPSIGGGEAVFFAMAKGMSELGHQVHIICHKKKPVHTDEVSMPSFDVITLKEMGVSIHGVKPELADRGGILLNYRQHIGYIINALRVGHNIVKGNKVDIIHANIYTPVIPAIMLGKIYRLPVVITVHNIMLGGWRDWSSQKNIPRITSIVGPLYEKMVLKMPADTFHVVSNKVRYELTQFNPGARATVVYNGIEPQVDLPLYSESKFGKFVLFVGRLVVRKNLQVVILAFKYVVKSLPEAKLIVAGDGPMCKQWQEFAKRNGVSKNVVFIGHVSVRKRNELLAKCSALVFPSTEEGFGLAVVEAFAMGKPVLVSDLDPFGEIVDDNIDGFLLPPHDPTKWSERIVYVLTNPEICKTMGERGRNKVIHKFNISAVSRQMESLYKNIISSRVSY